MYLPMTREEMTALGWTELDVILITGDAYLDSPFCGAAMLGKVLVQAGYRVGVIAQPRWDSTEDIKRLGEPRLWWGITAGCVDSMVANYTATGKRRHDDDFTPGGVNDSRPDRAIFVYTGLVRQAFKNTKPIVIGGIEASLRRVTHYDFWSDKIRRSVLFDAKADYLVFGMGERLSVEISKRLENGQELSDLKGLCWKSKTVPEGYIELPSHEECVADKRKFIEMFHGFYMNQDPITGKGIAQKSDPLWYLVQNVPDMPFSADELSLYHNQDWEREAHPLHAAKGPVKALETIRFSVLSHYGCYGECNFCAIAAHQGRIVQTRTDESIVTEAKRMTVHPKWKGIISDVGGPTANMLGIECTKKLKHGSCADKRCVAPTCPALRPNHSRQINLLRTLRALPKMRKVFVASGIRPDMLMDDPKFGEEYVREIAEHHTSGQLKLAPEHTDPEVLRLMGKNGMESVHWFRERFLKASAKAEKKQFLTYYMMAAHPGCSDAEMDSLRDTCANELGMIPEQVQIFTPTPSTYSTLMYATGLDPWTLQPVHVEKTLLGKNRQKERLVAKPSFARSFAPRRGPAAGGRPGSDYRPGGNGAGGHARPGKGPRGR